jgi:hypothetical protein
LFPQPKTVSFVEMHVPIELGDVWGFKLSTTGCRHIVHLISDDFREALFRAACKS